MKEKAARAAEMLRVLANDHRLMILCRLRKQPLTVGRLLEYIPDITQSALSQHLAVLKTHGVVEGERAGQTVTYRIADPRVGKVMDALRDAYCEGKWDE